MRKVLLRVVAPNINRFIYVAIYHNSMSKEEKKLAESYKRAEKLGVFKDLKKIYRNLHKS